MWYLKCVELENQPACGEVSSFVWVRAVLIYIWNPQLSMGMLPCQMTCCRGSSLAVDLKKTSSKGRSVDILLRARAMVACCWCCQRCSFTRCSCNAWVRWTLWLGESGWKWTPNPFPWEFISYIGKMSSVDQTVFTLSFSRDLRLMLGSRMLHVWKYYWS